MIRYIQTRALLPALPSGAFLCQNLLAELFVLILHTSVLHKVLMSLEVIWMVIHDILPVCWLVIDWHQSFLIHFHLMTASEQLCISCSMLLRWMLIHRVLALQVHPLSVDMMLHLTVNMTNLQSGKLPTFSLICHFIYFGNFILTYFKVYLFVTLSILILYAECCSSCPSTTTLLWKWLRKIV